MTHGIAILCLFAFIVGTLIVASSLAKWTRHGWMVEPTGEIMIKKFLSRFVTIQHGVLHSQSWGCWLFLQIGFTAVYFPYWGNGCGIRVNIGGPDHDPNTGYHCTMWGIGRIGFNVPRKLQLGQYS